MKSAPVSDLCALPSVKPLCPVFGECGGCLYQDLDYHNELKVKQGQFASLIQRELGLNGAVISPIVPSPKPYHYRNRLDLKLKRTKDNGILIGFTPSDKKGVVPVEACYIAEEAISDFIPMLIEEAKEKLPRKYRNANLTVRCGQEGRVLWGGIGRHSCRLPQEDYFWADIGNVRVFYSLDTFFQANTSILPELFERLYRFPFLTGDAHLFDLYGGVGLFGLGLSHRVKGVTLVEENISSLKIARHNIAHNQLTNIEVLDGRVEDHLAQLTAPSGSKNSIAMIDPPRAGLSRNVLEFFGEATSFSHILYLSCNPESLTRDLKYLTGNGWRVGRIIPFDFFPKTRHLEALCVLTSDQPKEG